MNPPVGCFTTGRATRGRVWYADHHARRLVRDAHLLGLGTLHGDDCLRALGELGAATQSAGRSIARLEVRRQRGALHLLPSRREWGDDPPVWRAAIATLTHPGASPTSQAKSSDRRLYESALAAARAEGADDALFLDRAGFLVEGARTNIVAVRADGALRTPPLARGCVAGVAREVLFERVPELQEGDLELADLAVALELIAINAVRGARAITHLDGRAIGDARPGSWCERLARALDEDC